MGALDRWGKEEAGLREGITPYASAVMQPMSAARGGGVQEGGRRGHRLEKKAWRRGAGKAV